MQKNFRQMLQAQWDKGKHVCVGLDTDFDKIPEWFHFFEAPGKDYIDATVLGVGAILSEYNIRIVKTTHDLVCAYKPNIAFYEAWGASGIIALVKTIEYIRARAPKVPIILDAKRGDIGNTNRQYIKMAFNHLKVEAMTIHPYLGQESLSPFLELKDKGFFILCKTSNPGAGEFQDQTLHDCDRILTNQSPLFHYVAAQVATKWNKNNNCGLVVGATYPGDLADVREIVGPNMPILIPGIGKQKGDLEATVKAGKNKDGQGIIINSSRGIIFASQETDFALIARKKVLELQVNINRYL